MNAKGLAFSQAGLAAGRELAGLAVVWSPAVSGGSSFRGMLQSFDSGSGVSWWTGSRLFQFHMHSSTCPPHLTLTLTYPKADSGCLSAPPPSVATLNTPPFSAFCFVSWTDILGIEGEFEPRSSIGAAWTETLTPATFAHTMIPQAVSNLTPWDWAFMSSKLHVFYTMCALFDFFFFFSFFKRILYNIFWSFLPTSPNSSQISYIYLCCSYTTLGHVIFHWHAVDLPGVKPLKSMTINCQ